jgi:hypothetical protein
MYRNKKFKEIYDKFDGNYVALIGEHLRLLKELEKYRDLFSNHTIYCKKKKFKN